MCLGWTMLDEEEAAILGQLLLGGTALLAGTVRKRARLTGYRERKVHRPGESSSRIEICFFTLAS